MGKFTNRHARGFSILELLVGMLIFLIISGSILVGMGQYQANYRTTEVSVQMQQQLRSTMELMAAEIGQAGLQASTVEGAWTGGDAAFVVPYKLSAVTATGVSSPTVTLGTGVSESPYAGQWLVVDGGVNQEAVQVTAVTTVGSTITITANFGIVHAVNTAAYPMGVFPHGILSDQSNATASGGGKLAMFGEINGSGNGLYAVEYKCPATFPGPLTREAWNLSAYNGTLPAATAYNLIDNVTACYFCWPGASSVNSSCPAGATPDTVTLPAVTTCPAGSPAADYCTYSMITQVGFTITVTEPVTISGTSQNVSVTKSYSNIQPRNLVTADKIYNAACTSAINAGSATCAIAASPYTTYAPYLNGELQPDPPALASVPW